MESDGTYPSLVCSECISPEARRALPSHLQVETGITPNRVDLTVKQAETAFLLGNLDQSSEFLHQAATNSITLGSQLLLDDIHDLYVKMKRAQPREKRVLELEELFRTL
jgi:hypothetical protein